ncbi:hypothetical protein DY000_02062164 [Brassica cretica]|uniref:Uncharacterized protein n=1 Tax=Brassica cretica TaxID=69181 RepID=A0ABQ7B326_BRACR|nr:hypothetical protein DY000_02062164 [Brassica cretica]
MPSSFCFGEEWLLFTYHLSPSLAELNSSFSYHASSPTLPLKLETEYREGLSLKNRKSPLHCHNMLSTLFRVGCGLLHRMLAISFTSPLSQHPLYPLWSRLWTSPQNVSNRLHLIILLFKLEMSLNELQDQEHTTLTAALKSLIHPFAFSFKYPQITGLPYDLGGDLLLLLCLEP